MAIIQCGNDPDCKHEKATKEEKASLGLIPIYESNCLVCGSYLFRFPGENEVSKEEMKNRFDQTERLLKGKPTD
jgi:hypothetical protein